MNITEYLQELKSNPAYKGNLQTQVPLSTRTTFQIGGNAAALLEPSDKQSLAFAIEKAITNNLKYFLLGGGSNLVFSDQGFNGIVITTEKINPISAEYPEPQAESQFTLITCGSGAKTSDFVNFATENSLSGAESFAGLPGSIGGALFMNARCFDTSISQILHSYEYYSLEDHSFHKELFNESEWAYKSSPFQKKPFIITSATFKLSEPQPQNHEEIKKQAESYIEQRRSKGHFKYPSAGSVFKNNHAFGKPSGQLIDECGLKGHKIGSAQIAPWHGNFIINTARAKSTDVKALVDLAVSTVKQKTGFELEPEIIFVNS